MNATFRPAALIGIYNHGDTIADVVAPLRALELACHIVDDGSDARTQEQLAELARRDAGVAITRLPINRGKGAALSRGLEWLDAGGFTHALVLDADGQHDVSDVPALLDAARRRPNALVLAQPTFGTDAPKSRLYGRRISQFWVHVETWSRAIGDPLCGFRCYPLRATVDLLRRERIGLRMEFDPELAVRLVWSGVPVINVPTHVIYPPGGRSHFRVVRDNLGISWMHTRLCAGMLARIPTLLARPRVPSTEAAR